MENTDAKDNTVKLRRWQMSAFRRLSRFSKKNLLVVATPGSGKSLLAMYYASQLLRERRVERIVIVCPSNHLRRQWAKAAARLGIHLNHNWANSDGVEAADYQGVVVTYQQVASAPDLYDMNCKRPTIVIFDEIHHAGDELTWGNAIRRAFYRAKLRLCLSGTPFRSDNNPIPFVTYNDGKSKADFEYGYADALSDNGVCRPVYFPSYEGEIEWISRDGEIEQCSLGKAISRSKAAERLRATIDPQADWLKQVIRDADAKLTEMRQEGHADAGGLIITLDQRHAERIAELAQQVTGERAVLAISDDPDASEKISRFASGNHRWIVAVKMVSEGVDIPRLRVGVYATNVLSELFFRQLIGRLIRWVDGVEEQSAVLYIPAVEDLVRFAREIKEERNHQLEEEIRSTSGYANDATLTNGDLTKSLFKPICARAVAHEVIYEQASYNQAELKSASKISNEMGIKLPAPQVAALLRRGAAEAGVFVIHGNEVDEPDTRQTHPTKSDRKLALRRSTQRLANTLAYVLGTNVRDVHAEWISQGGNPHSSATEQDLQQKQEWLLRRIREVGRG